MTKRCEKCQISEHVYGIHFNDQSLCNLCEAWQAGGKSNLAETRKILSSQLDEILNKSKNTSSEYQCILAYSGGKDSTYALYKLTQSYKLKVLAYTIDNGFVADAAIENGKNVCNNLGVDWIIYRPSPKFVNETYRNSIKNSPYDKKTLTRSSEVCASCIQIVNSAVLKEAIRRYIPLIAGGYIGTQVPADSPVMRISPLIQEFKKKTLEQLNMKLHPEFSRYVGLNQNEALNIQTFSPVIINPLLLEDYNEQDIINKIKEIGWIPPQTTGKNSSNCLINEYAISEHISKYKFHPYELEICQQIRHGFLSKEEGLNRLNYVAEKDYYEHTREKLDKS